jgi:hypothetical protein
MSLRRYLATPVDGKQVAYKTRDGLEIALRNLASIDFVSLTDFYGVSVCILAHKFGRREQFDSMCRCDATLEKNDNSGIGHKENKAPAASFQFEFSTVDEVRVCWVFLSTVYRPLHLLCIEPKRRWVGSSRAKQNRGYSTE